MGMALASRPTLPTLPTEPLASALAPERGATHPPLGNASARGARHGKQEGAPRGGGLACTAMATVPNPTALAAGITRKVAVGVDCVRTGLCSVPFDNALQERVSAHLKGGGHLKSASASERESESESESVLPEQMLDGPVRLQDWDREMEVFFERIFFLRKIDIAQSWTMDQLFSLRISKNVHTGVETLFSEAFKTQMVRVVQLKPFYQSEYHAGVRPQESVDAHNAAVALRKGELLGIFHRPVMLTKGVGKVAQFDMRTMLLTVHAHQDGSSYAVLHVPLHLSTDGGFRATRWTGRGVQLLMGVLEAVEPPYASNLDSNLCSLFLDFCGMPEHRKALERPNGGLMLDRTALEKAVHAVTDVHVHGIPCGGGVGGDGFLKLLKQLVSPEAPSEATLEKSINLIDKWKLAVREFEQLDAVVERCGGRANSLVGNLQQLTSIGVLHKRNFEPYKKPPAAAAETAAVA